MTWFHGKDLENKKKDKHGKNKPVASKMPAPRKMNKPTQIRRHKGNNKMNTTRYN
jgi:hypothetical protein